METEFSLALIGGGNMANALASGLIGRRCAAGNVHVIDPDAGTRGRWDALGTTTAAAPGARLSECSVWFFAVKPQVMAQVVRQCQPWLRPDTLVISIAAGIPGAAIARWLGTDGRPYDRIVRCMPNTPALIASGMTGMTALPGVDESDRALAETLLRAVGEIIWVDGDAAIDAVTAVSGSGPAYVFLFLESLIAAGIEQGLTPDQARQLALGTFHGATQLAALSPDSPAVLRERVTSKGGTTAAALAVFQDRDLPGIMRQAVAAAAQRAGELAREFSA
ncbi:MAG: pyrroline-5-carboxylate reductase [Castellaniella sp.]|uniref:pyrroline-5-carboxylate reductase n=1 Tax=Castellaniella sp. TaxID=1955812 RepID=UPI002A35FD44|nr:pyrroline-5-carboxylate reductase [Castellaniella sp.]MDY0309765.1 pyrroline-5-carboxylate reductase [Castellaniella sp.]